MQMAFQGWRAVVLHMAARREQLQQAALASAERAIQKGCHAASVSTVASHICSDKFATLRSPQLSLPEQQDRICIQVGQQGECILRHTDPAGPVQAHVSQTSVVEPASTPHQGAVELTAAFFKASAHWSEKLQARVLGAWQELSRQATASVWQQHELKALANQQLLQVNTADFPCFCCSWRRCAQTVVSNPKSVLCSWCYLSGDQQRAHEVGQDMYSV